MSVLTALNQIRDRIESAAKCYGRDPASVTLLAISKHQSMAKIKQAIEAGQREFGESYVQEALQKIEALSVYTEANHLTPLVWHFIGPIQSNKTKAIAQNFDWVHSVDRLKIAQRLSAQRPEAKALLNVCIEVNVSGEESKSGVSLDEIDPLARKIDALPRLRLRGLMAIPSRSEDVNEQRRLFHLLKKAFDGLNAKGFNLDMLSMGMSGDFEAAIAEDSTLVRIGSGIFGQRPRV